MVLPLATKTINTDALGWIISRVTRKSVDGLLSDRIWSRMGSEQDAYYTIGSTGTPYAGGGLNAGLRDMARIGQLLLDDGVINGQRLIPEAASASIRLASPGVSTHRDRHHGGGTLICLEFTLRDWISPPPKSETTKSCNKNHQP